MIGRKDSTTEKLYRILANFSRSVKNMIGATHSSDGAAGLVPPPRAGDEDKALLGNGTWGKVDSIYKYKTEEEYNQAVANNEIPDGATVIKEWDEELSVIPVDSELSEESLNPLQNKVIAQKIAELNQSIEELNGLLGGKLDVSKIANNLVTTEEGYALDARMGKALSEKIDLHRKTLPCFNFGMRDTTKHFKVTGDSGLRAPFAILLITGQLDGVEPIVLATKNDPQRTIITSNTGVVLEGSTVNDLKISSVGGDWGTYTFVPIRDVIITEI